ncbi:hypothetical protein B0J13DRAFT_136305 [Dactylonectria estremocensis]|uniref:Uncharacterized protein n=1 Tax=Dactylonectria estremocensis TaxID=1079267 RepID=A0A9P9E1U2_9HYPO|nr:hypothetical protein B0J13DRAFT_136305 [Dactylonectria estremocensis]
MRSSRARAYNGPFLSRSMLLQRVRVSLCHSRSFFLLCKASSRTYGLSIVIDCITRRDTSHSQYRDISQPFALPHRQASFKILSNLELPSFHQLRHHQRTTARIKISNGESGFQHWHQPLLFCDPSWSSTSARLPLPLALASSCTVSTYKRIVQASASLLAGLCHLNRRAIARCHQRQAVRHHRECKCRCIFDKTRTRAACACAIASRTRVCLATNSSCFQLRTGSVST